MRAPLGCALAAAIILSPAALLGQAEVSALAVDSEPLTTTGELRISRFADLSEETRVSVGTRLEIGDLLTSVSPEVDVELSCGESAQLRFSGGFRLLIESPEETDCAVDLLSGTLDTLTEVPVEVEAGDVTLGVEGTQFSFSLTRGDDGPDRDLSVFEGMVRVRTGGLDEEVGTGRTWRMARGEPVWGEVSQERAERSAALFARLDVAKSVAAGEPVEDKESSYDRLRRLHLEVLTRPGDTESRVELARAQLEYKRDDAAAYHLRKADVTTEEQLQKYQIDKRVLSRMGAPKVDAGSLSSAGAPRRISGAAVRKDPYELLQSGNYEAAIELLEEQAEKAPSSKVFYGLARAWAGLEGGSSRAAGYAARALRLQATDRKLSPAEERWCRRLRAGLGS